MDSMEISLVKLPDCNLMYMLTMNMECPEIGYYSQQNKIKDWTITMPVIIKRYLTILHWVVMLLTDA